MVIATCPECYQEVQVSESPKIGHHVLCENCGMKLEVVWLYPLALDFLDEVRQPLNEIKGFYNSRVELDNG
jgi:lysine biosynthesis protein LysW